MTREAPQRPGILALAIGVAISGLSCRQPTMKKIGGDWYLDAVPAGTASPHLYRVKDGQRTVVDRQIRAYAHAGCLLYETVRPGMASVIVAVESGKTPVPVAASDALRPWRVGRNGLRRFDSPATDEHGKTTLAMEAIDVNDLCMLAWRQPAYSDDWATRPLAFPEIRIKQTSFDVHGADDSVGNTTLSDEVRERHPDVVDELIRAGADVNAPNRYGTTPLMTAIAYNDEDTIILRQLLDAGADINAQDKDGRTALMTAAFYNRREAVAVLLARGADASIRDNNGRNAAATVRDSAPELHRLLDDAAKQRR